MRTLILFVVAAIPLAAQNPTVRMNNLSRPGSGEFQVGDRFEIVIAGPAKQPISIRTIRNYGRTDWGPAIDSTDADGRWSTSGQFEKTDFGQWSEAWTVGGKVANPVVSFWVTGPCLADGQNFMQTSGPNVALDCKTAAGPQSFITPSVGDSFRTPDGRVISGRARSAITAEEYRTEMMQSMIVGGDVRPGKIAVEAGELIPKMIGVNALTEAEAQKVLLIIRAAYGQSAFHASAAAKPAMLLLLQQLDAEAETESLKGQISATTAFVQAQ